MICLIDSFLIHGIIHIIILDSYIHPRTGNPSEPTVVEMIQKLGRVTHKLSLVLKKQRKGSGNQIAMESPIFFLMGTIFWIM